MKKHKNKIITGVILVAILSASLFWGGFDREGVTEPNGTGNAPVSGSSQDSQGSPETGSGNAGSTSAGSGESSGSGLSAGAAESGDPQAGQGTQTPQPTQDLQGSPAQPTSSQTHDAQVRPEQTASHEPQGSQEPPESQAPQGSASPTPAVPSESPAQPSPDNTGQPGDGEADLTCTLIISCATILDNMDRLTDGKAGLVPHDGIVFSGTVVFYENESVFNVLLREVRRNRIHMEFVNTPIYNSAYIEGINNLYEFDCGERSGWMYSVNGLFPNYGSSRYELRDGDVIRWLFTCDRGDDVGGGDAAGSYGFGS